MTVFKLTEWLGLTESCIRVSEDITGRGPNYYGILGDDYNQVEERNDQDYDTTKYDS